MTNKNISGLTAATTPLAGTELVPVWDGATKKVAVADLTAGRAVSVSKVLAADGTQALPSYSFTSDPATGLFYGSGYLQVSVSNTVYAIIGSANIYLERPTSVTGNVSSTRNFVPTTAAKGINFTANTPAAGMTSQLLNWYEEGTWTTGVSFGGASTGVTYASTTGYYTRVGRLVHVSGIVILTNKGSSTGSARITGLPFAIVNNTGAYSPVALRFNVLTYTGSVMGYGTIGATTIEFTQVTEAGVSSALTDANFANTTSIMISLTYRT